MRKLLLLLSVAYICVSCGIEAGDGVETSDGVGLNEHRIFVSSTTTNGSFGGVSGGDTICQNAADAAGFSRTYKAVLSDTSNGAKDRLTFSGAIYKVSQGIKTLVAGTGSALWNTSNANLTARIDKDENGSTVSANVWTGTTSDGSLNAGSNCSDWSSTGTPGTYGSTDQFDTQWTNENFGTDCLDSTLRVYCVSQ